MNINITFNANELINAAEKEPFIAIQEIHNAVEKSLYKIENTAKREAPAKSGDLRKHIGSKFEILKGSVESKASYSIYVHEGTKPHDIFPVNKKVLADKRKKIIFGKRVRHPGTKPNQYMLRAVEKEINTITRYFDEAVNNILIKI